MGSSMFVPVVFCMWLITVLALTVAGTSLLLLLGAILPQIGQSCPFQAFCVCQLSTLQCSLHG